MTPTKHNSPSVEGVPADELKERLAWLVSDLHPIDHMDCAVLLLATCDLRPREVLALTWADADLGGRTLRVCRSLGTDGGTAPAKIARTIKIGPAAVEALRERRAVQGRYFKRYAPTLATDEGGSPAPAPDAPIVSTPEGKPVQPKALSRWWRDKRADASMFGWTLADLRRARMAVEALEAEAGR